MGEYRLDIPDDVYARAVQVADALAQSVEQVMIEHLRTLTTPLPALPPDEEAELKALKNLSDDALWAIARERLTDEVQTRMQTLMDRNSVGIITAGEYQELAGLVERGQQMMVRKSEAAALLTLRGYVVILKDSTSRD